VKLVHARIVQNDCAECLKALLAEAQSLGGLPLTGEVVMIPEHWLNTPCPHGSPGLKFQLVELDELVESDELLGAEGEESIERVGARDTRMDATKNIGYPVREHGPYGSHPMHDDFDDESDPDGSGTY
jgi:hypothetical protein